MESINNKNLADFGVALHINTMLCSWNHHIIGGDTEVLSSYSGFYNLRRLSALVRY